MNIQNIEEVNVNIVIENEDSSKGTFAEEAYKITDEQVLSIYIE
ncbi:hypothetical protein OCB14_15185 [Bacillus cereus]|nr:hypothetical protein [Bacillus thuringiensis]MCU5130688.1 hypothetical protein [Bacillus cereus]MCU5542985.1 hypothetical protein [Bacillus cereus]